jgi:hypothetical protein
MNRYRSIALAICWRISCRHGGIRCSQGQGSMFESFVVLSEPFFNELVNRPVPVDMRALKALKQSPFALDVYSWLTYRFFTIQRRTEIPWEALQMQFGTETESERKFRALFRKALKDVLVVYPGPRWMPTLRRR